MNTGSLSIAVTGINALSDNPGPGVAVAKSLRHSEFSSSRIIGLGYDALDPGFYLPQYIDEAYLIPYPSSGESALINRIREIHKDSPIDVLIPTLDAELSTYVRMSQQLLEMGIKTFLPSAEQIRLRNKDHLEELAEMAGIACPEMKILTSPRFFEDCDENDWPYPFVIKGIFYDAKIVYNKWDAIKAFHHITREWGFPVLVQKLIYGEEYNLTAIGDGKGELINPVMMKKLATTDKGKAWAGVSINDSSLLNSAKKLVSTLRWKGPLEVEVIRDKHGVYQLIEINPRFPAWIYLSTGVNRNLPEALVKLALKHDVFQSSSNTSGKIFIRFAEDTIIDIKEFEAIVMQGNDLMEN